MIDLDFFTLLDENENPIGLNTVSHVLVINE